MTTPPVLNVLAVPLTSVEVQSAVTDLAGGAVIYDDRLSKKCSVCKRWFISDQAIVQLIDKSFCHFDQDCTKSVDGELLIKAEYGGPIPVAVLIVWPDILRLIKEQDEFFKKMPKNPIYTHLMEACENGNYAIVVWLVEIKCHNVNERSRQEGFTPLMATCEGARTKYNAASIGHFVAIFKFLMANGASMYLSTYEEGWTAHRSAHGVREILELFRSDAGYDKYFRQKYLKEDHGLLIRENGSFTSC